jgi:NAD(P)H-dependent flavin oxidoreductase YrpB (nitropropane dioxygenase family)
MNVAAGPKLAAAVTNAGGIGVIGGVGYSPEMLKEQVPVPFPLNFFSAAHISAL